MKKPALADVFLLGGYIAVCYGCYRCADWLGFTVGGALLMWYAWKREVAQAIKRGR